MQILVKPPMGETVTLEVGSSDTVRGRRGERSGAKRLVEHRRRLLLQEKGRMLIPGRESARGSPRRTQAARTKFNGSGIGKKDGEVIRRPAQMRRTTTRSKATAAPEICQPGCMSRDVSLALLIVRSLELRGCIPRREATCTAAITHTRYGV